MLDDLKELVLIFGTATILMRKTVTRKTRLRARAMMLGAPAADALTGTGTGGGGSGGSGGSGGEAKVAPKSSEP